MRGIGRRSSTWSPPVFARELLERCYEAGLTHLEYAEHCPEQLRVDQEIGEIDTTWVVYGTQKRFAGSDWHPVAGSLCSAAAEERPPRASSGR
jgi:hypothetical protein